MTTRFSKEWFQVQGRKGGKRRLKTMTKTQRVAQARKAAKARWSRKRGV
jgi:hypothetical protein